MRAITITGPGGPEVLQLVERPAPVPGSGEVLVRVSFAGVNRADLLQRMGKYPAPPGVPPDVPGLEIMGTVDTVGPGASRWQRGDRVFGILGGGGYAAYAVSHEALLAPVPRALENEAAGAVPEVFMTAQDALHQAGFAAGDHVLIHAAGSGVATAAIQLVRALGGTSYGTARSVDKLQRALDLGLDFALDLPDFASAARAATGGRGVDIVLDFVGAPYLAGNLESLAPRGRLVQIGTMAGTKTEINLGIVMAKRLQIIGTVLRSRTHEEKASVTERFSRTVLPLLQQGAVRPVVDRVFALQDAADAHRYLESNATFGKVLLRTGR